MPNKSEKMPKKAKNKPNKANIIPKPPKYFNGYSKEKWEELAPVFIKKICFLKPIYQPLNYFADITGTLWIYTKLWLINTAVWQIISWIETRKLWENI